MTPQDMEARIVRYGALKPCKTAFIDAHTPGSDQKENFTIIGGGVSQFTTTLYNAVFWGGYQDVDHKPHSYYFSRYPMGIEATLDYVSVPLVWRNNDTEGAYVNTYYTDTSITVEMYSTKYWEVEQTGQAAWRSGACRSVETFRSRTNPDGEVLEDSVSARYRPGEGLDCNGNPTPKPRG